MNRGEPMMGQPDPCWVTIDRERGFGYRGRLQPVTVSDRQKTAVPGSPGTAQKIK